MVRLNPIRNILRLLFQFLSFFFLYIWISPHKFKHCIRKQKQKKTLPKTGCFALLQQKQQFVQQNQRPIHGYFRNRNIPKIILFFSHKNATKITIFEAI